MLPFIQSPFAMSLRLLLASFLATALLLGCGTEDSSEAERMAQEHEDDTTTASAAAREPAIPVDTSTVVYAETDDGTSITGYAAAPVQADSVLAAHGMDPETDRIPALVVIHEWWGLNDNVRTATRRLAGEGYRALAVDLYGGATAETPEEAKSLVEQATSDPKRMMSNIRAAFEYLQSEAGALRIGVLGWCFGGSRTFQAVASDPSRFDAAVAYYGSPEPLTEDVLQEVTTPILAHFGRQDEAIPMTQVKAFQSRVEGLDKDIQIHLYDAGHAFANPTGDSYVPEAAKLAWSRTTDFLRMRLYPERSE